MKMKNCATVREREGQTACFLSDLVTVSINCWVHIYSRNNPKTFPNKVSLCIQLKLDLVP